MELHNNRPVPELDDEMKSKAKVAAVGFATRLGFEVLDDDVSVDTFRARDTDENEEVLFVVKVATIEDEPADLVDVQDIEEQYADLARSLNVARIDAIEVRVIAWDRAILRQTVSVIEL